MNAVLQTPEVEQSTKFAEMKFRFKQDKLGNQRPSVNLMIPVPTVTGIKEILEKGDAKEIQLILDAMYDVTRDVVTGYVAEQLDISQENFPFDKATWTAIAYMDKKDRRSSSIPEETWAAFAADYISIMPALTGKTTDNVTNATIVFLKKFSIIKSDKKSISKLKDQLAIYVENTKKLEEFQDILELLISKADTYLAANDIEQLVANL